MADLRSFVFLDSLQPQLAAYLGTVAKGFLPVVHEAASRAPAMIPQRAKRFSAQVENEVPQPHADFAFGFWNLKPAAVSVFW